MGWMIKGLSPGRGWEFFFSPPCPDWLWDPSTPYVMGRRGLSLGVKWPGHKAEHSPPSSALPQYFSMVWCSVKAEGELYLHLPEMLRG